MAWEHWHEYAALKVKEGGRPEDPAESFWLELFCKMIKETDDQPDGVELVEEPQKVTLTKANIANVFFVSWYV